jgi:hypothetical protein
MFKNFIQSHKARFSDENGYPEYKSEDMEAAFNAGRKSAAIECVEVAAPEGSQFCVYCLGMLMAIKEKFGLEI